jgi:hypothetical protein
MALTVPSTLAAAPELVAKLRAWLPTASPSEQIAIAALLASLPAEPATPPADPEAAMTAVERGRAEARRRFGPKPDGAPPSAVAAAGSSAVERGRAEARRRYPELTNSDPDS